ncbi:MAG: T9SS C-terminal target domain-containing protein [Porphyromonadaceae bacterium]|nr:MAG: T9SS C-terminal target domain-containing protein [Porphyromonadaceae bacterium]
MKKFVFAQIICMVLSLSMVKADQPTSPGTKVFNGYDIYSTTIVKEGTIWKQWFAGWMTASDLPWDRIYYASSADSGSTWSIPQLAFTIEKVQVNDPTVLRLWDSLNSRFYYLMYYTYYPSGYGDPTNYIASSTSLDGITWAHNGLLIGADNGIDTDGAWSPTAYSADSTGRTVYLYFHNNHPDGRIFRTTLSNNGLSFDKTTTISVTSAGGLRANPDVSRSGDGKWWMFYNGSSVTSDNKGNFNTCKMYSDDGVNWQESGHNPIQQYDTMTTCTPFVLWTSDSTYQLWYGYGTPTFMDFSVYRQYFTLEAEPVLNVVASSEALKVMEAAKAIDKDPGTFWSSVGYVGSAAHIEWIYLNLGIVKNVTQVVLTPRVVSGSAMCFPVDFKFQNSPNGINWTDISGQTYANYKCDTLDQEFVLNSSVATQYIRLYATKLSADSYGNYYCQIAEMNIATNITSVEIESSGLPDELGLLQNFPNPFNASTTVTYAIPEESNVSLIVYDIFGRQVAGLVKEVQSKGTFKVVWNGINDKGKSLASGYYLYTLSVDGRNFTRKMLIVK